ncbi:O-acetyltransferase PaAT-1 [Fulvia fulva]|nr:O-acetyltransferase PaAT-1 [Fulvia fulva]WPV14530.1 O-acetyltransferase PaAT-1 [Fulvia fulva]WPV30024.1 O-acetyltransferase PaAT-1 [Fulvia fulva]
MLANLRSGPLSGWRQLLTLQTLIGYPSPITNSNGKLRETAWLDGLRGLAAFLVMIYHFNITFWNTFYVEAPFGSITIPDEKLGLPGGWQLWDFWRLPFLRLWMCSGHAQVSVFFVLSGIVLSWGPLGNIQAGRGEKVLESLGSATFRRWVRLYVPCFVIAGWEVCEMWVGWRDMGVVGRRGSFLAQFWDYLQANERFANPFLINRDAMNANHGYDWTMWTIPYEFSGSMLVFVVLLAVSRVREYGRRTMVLGGVVIYACLRAEWNFWLFATGMLIANYVRHAGGFEELTRNTSKRLHVTCIVMLIVGMLLAGMPSHSQFYTRPGYEWLRSIIPSNWLEIEGGTRFWWCWSGILFIFGACHVTGIRQFFEFSFMRYLGRVSYMLYLTHRIVLNVAGSTLRSVVYSFIGRKDVIDDNAEDGTILHPLFTFMGYIVLLSALIPMCLIVAHWTEMGIDKPSTKLARRIDDWFIGSPSREVVHQGENGSLLPSHTDATTQAAADIELLHTTNSDTVAPTSAR